MTDSWPILDLDDIERRAETGDIDRTDVRALVADVRRKLTGLAAAERERDAVQQQFEAAMAGLGELNQHHGVGEVGAILRRTFQAIAAVPISQDAPDDPAVSR